MKPEIIFNTLEALRQKKPVIHNITNFVAMQITANILLALGASPIMAHEASELAEIMKIANALLINIGTLDKEWIKSMFTAQQLALQQSIPIVLDPVGAGATMLRTQTTLQFLQKGIHILRGNASEIMSLVDNSVITKGVDSSEKSETAIYAALYLAKKYKCIVVISGAIDVITDGERLTKNHNGTTLFTKVTAMGCSLSAVIAAFAAVNANYFDAAVQGISLFTLAGEKAAQKSLGPGTFGLHLLDEIMNMTMSDFNAAKIYA